MKITVCTHAGLCSGAQLAYETAKEQANENLYLFGEVLHNPIVTSQLKEKGAKVISSINEVKYLENKEKIIVLIRAHGVPKSIIEELEENKIKYLDRTCKEVKKIHDIVNNKSKKNYEIIIIGNKDHPEVIGTVGWSNREPIILADMNEAKKVVPSLVDKRKKYCIVVQTTYNLKNYEKIVEYCKRHLERVEYFNTICSDTENRQLELADKSKEADAVIVIGGKNSSNSNKLYKIAAKNCKNVQFIETYKELDFSAINENSSVLIAGGASTPNDVIEEVKKCLWRFSRDMQSLLVQK